MIQKFLFKLRSTFFSPNDKLELWLRTLYHKLNKTRVMFIIQNWYAQRSYQQWKKWQNQLLDRDSSTDNEDLKITFLLTYNSRTKSELEKTLDSIRNLDSKNWEVIIFLSESDLQSLLPQKINRDIRINIVQAKSLAEICAIQGDFIVFCQPGDVFHKRFLTHFCSLYAQDNSVDWVYFDCEYSEGDANKLKPLFKPSTLSPEQLLSHNYLSRGLIRRSFLQENLAELSTYEDPLAGEYHLAFLLCQNHKSVRYLPHVYVCQTNLVRPETPERQEAVKTYLSGLGLEDVAVDTKENGYRFTWRTSQPSVAIVIPTKNQQALLAPLVHSILHKTNYKNLQIHIIDNKSDDPDTLGYYAQIKSDPHINIHPYEEEFNYSAVNNLGVAKSDSDLILLLNDDMEIRNPDWLSELVQWAIRPEIGVVGAKLVRANRTIQHAGIIIGLNGFAGHIYLNAPEHYNGLFGSVNWYRNYMAVTGACQMFRREVFNQVNGYDEGYKVAFGDVDFCLRVHNLGYRNVYTPFAGLFHFEGQSRGFATPSEDILRGYAQMESALHQEDPYFSPNLTYARIPKCIRKKREPEDIKNLAELRKQSYLKKN
jgi:GT2 family glycosyltransferase